jgi:hypothetical protein
MLYKFLQIVSPTLSRDAHPNYNPLTQKRQRREAGYQAVIEQGRVKVSEETW